MSSDSTDARNTSVASSPFNHATADVIIRTSDGVEFHLFKPILVIASSFFETMFSITQPESAHAGTATRGEPIDISEDSQTFDPLMRFVYPVDDPTLPDLDVLEKVLEAAVKYELVEAVKLASTMMRTQFVQTHPLDVFAVACRLHLEEEAKQAAEAWKLKAPKCAFHAQFALSIAGASFVPRMGQISAGAYSRLLAYLREPTIPVASFTTASPSVAVAFDSTPDAGDAATPCTEEATSSDWSQRDPTGADFVLLSTDGARFSVHSPTLRIASAEKLLDGLRTNKVDRDEDQTDLLPVVLAELDSPTLNLLLDMCYPFSHTVIKRSAAELLAVYRAAQKFGIKGAVHLVRERFKGMIRDGSDLMTLYFIATEEAWTNDAEEIARLIAEKGLQDSYTPQMDQSSSSAQPLHRLLRLCNDYRVAMIAAVQQFAPRCPPQSLSMDGPISSVVPNTYLPILEQLVSEQTNHYAGSMRQAYDHRLCSIGWQAVLPYSFDRDAWLAKGNNLDQGLKNALVQLKLEVD